MLTLERKERESIILDTADGQIVIVLNKAKDGKAKLAIDAPRQVNIRRGEIARTT